MHETQKIKLASKIEIIMTKLYCIILFLYISSYIATIPIAYSNNETDFQALIAFKNAIQSDPQGALNSWNETNHFCSWQGISCGHKHQNRVVAIDIFTQGLTGPISPHLGNLSFLRSIKLYNNILFGQIPNEIGRLKRLQHLNFANNSLSGEIPKNISRCTNINYLSFARNHITGIIPVELSSLTKLEYLRLSKNQLSGTIPPFIGNFSNLIQLALAQCRMQGSIPKSLVQLKSLKYLYIGVNNLTGRIPHGLFNISSMIHFMVYSNRLEGTIPSDIGSTFASSFTVLNLWGNLFTGEIPDSLSNISSLERILLQNNNFKGRVKVNFSKLSALNSLDLHINDLEGDLGFISSAINCSQLVEFFLSDNQLSGLLPHTIGNFSSSIMTLSLGNNNLHGNIPSSIGNLLGLSGLYLGYNYLDGLIPSEIGNLNNLQKLQLLGNMFTYKIPFSFGNLTSLTHLLLNQNNLVGSIPQSLGNCTDLLQLDISYNSLDGPIPPQIMISALSLLFFDSSHNELIGSIPMEVGSLINLEHLDLSYNRLSGYVPDSLSTCLTLEKIYLQKNSFHGEISNALGKLRGLQHIDLSQNSLSGTIPTFLSELDLLYLNLSYNSFEGRVPSQGVFLNVSALSLEGNKDLCGGISSLNFTPCSHENSKKHKHFPMVFKVLISVISIGAISLACYCIYICVQGKSKHTQTSDKILLEEGYLRLSYADLQKSTGGFSMLNLLGAGKFGSVYKGILHDGQISVALKVLHLKVKGASKSFMSECNVLKGIRYRNILKILSVCSSIDFQENDFKALVYEFMENGNLETWLHHKSEDRTQRLSLRQRLDIVIDIAFALEYLHAGTDSTFIHGDLKPSNILLDEDMTAHVGDFGLAKIVSDIFSTNESSTSVGIRGTFGYIPPEYGVSGLVSAQGDVYSYGILLLEMFTGRRPTHEEFGNMLDLRDFVRIALPSQVIEVLDPAIIHEYNHMMNVKLLNCMVSVLEIGLTCSSKLPRDRMKMNDVVNLLLKASKILYES